METLIYNPRGRVSSIPRLDIMRRPAVYVPSRNSSILKKQPLAPSILLDQITYAELEQRPGGPTIDWFVNNPRHVNYRKLAVNLAFVLLVVIMGYAGYNVLPSSGYGNQALARSGLSEQSSSNEPAPSLLPGGIVADSQSESSVNLPTNDEGLSAFLREYSESHPGVYGVSIIEINGQNRQASYNGAKSFTTASTYKLFVAYSALKRVEDGIWHWSDQITGGRNLSSCLDDMIVKSDNSCGATLLAKIGYKNITNEAKSIGCYGTSFMGKENIVTTADDLGLLMVGLQSGKVLSQQSSRDLLIGLLKRNIYRKGIPAGLSDSVVANKVGFMGKLLHDASIVYGGTGTYVLVIMSEGSSWSTIADFAKRVEVSRAQ